MPDAVKKIITSTTIGASGAHKASSGTVGSGKTQDESGASAGASGKFGGSSSPSGDGSLFGSSRQALGASGGSSSSSGSLEDVGDLQRRSLQNLDKFSSSSSSSSSDHDEYREDNKQAGAEAVAIPVGAGKQKCSKCSREFKENWTGWKNHLKCCEGGRKAGR